MRSGILGLAGIALLGFGGNWAGHRVARAGLFHGSAIGTKSSSGDAAPPPQPSSAPLRQDQVATALKRLRALAAASPNLAMDFDAAAQVDSLIAGLSAAELAALYAGIDPSFYNYNLRILSQKIGLAWVAKDPDAALAAAFSKSTGKWQGRYLALTIYGQWSQNEPAAALAWLNAAELPPSLAGLKEDFRSAALTNLAGRDFELATAELLKMQSRATGDGPSAQGVLSQWGYMYADDPPMRDQLIEFAKSTGRPEDYADLNSSLLHSWSQEDSLGMLTYLQDLRGYLESDAVPAASRPAVDATAVSAAISREYTGPALEWWMERYGQSPDTPEPMREAISRWVQKYPDAARQWFDQQPESPQRDALNAAAIPAFLSQGKFSEAAHSIAGIRDPALRQPAVERLEILWKIQDPAAAAAWQATLPNDAGGEK
ncbi:hypothetical protein [Luteolibacter sp. Populi]|uniref:hypothetical protein n=1 Tax=Luteolibacter sp. Populi TaxID=3230487 RepID=UPI003467E676